MVSDTTYTYSDGAYYARVIQEGAVVYQVVPPPPGAIIATLPAGCKEAHVNNATYQNCGGYYYQRVSNGYQVVVVH